MTRRLAQATSWCRGRINPTPSSFSHSKFISEQRFSQARFLPPSHFRPSCHHRSNDFKWKLGQACGHFTDAPPSCATTFIPVSPSLDDTTVRLEASTALLEPLGRCVAARLEWRREEFPNSKLLTLRDNAAEPAAPGSGNIALFPPIYGVPVDVPYVIWLWFKNYGGQGSRRIFFLSLF